MLYILDKIILINVIFPQDKINHINFIRTIINKLEYKKLIKCFNLRVRIYEKNKKMINL